MGALDKGHGGSPPLGRVSLHERTPRLGRYVVLQHLASGGMADVMLGRSDGLEGFERHVVLKLIRPDLARDQRFIWMFLDEARVAATLHHQHIVQVYDVGETDGEYFIAMEYVHGEDVRKLLSVASRQRAHVPLSHAIAIVSAVAAGLHYAHERRGPDMQPLDIVHRDISPSNILVGYDGSVKIVDFGVATASIFQETRSGSLKGKISHMSPEQCRGEYVDRRSDVYSLGVVLYELATTTRMVKGESDYAMMEQIVHGKIAPPESRRPGLPSALTAIIMRALATDREQRYASAEELRIALDQFASSSAITASTSTLAEYMREVFGQRLEPWLELDGRVTGAAEEVPTAPVSPGERLPSNRWSNSPREAVRSNELTGALPVPGSARRIERSVVPDPPSELPRLRPVPAKVLLAVPLFLLIGIAAGLWLTRGEQSTQWPQPPPVAAVATAATSSPPAGSGPAETPTIPTAVAESPAGTQPPAAEGPAGALPPVAEGPAGALPPAAAVPRDAVASPAVERAQPERRPSAGTRSTPAAPPRRTERTRSEHPARPQRATRDEIASPSSGTSPAETPGPSPAAAVTQTPTPEPAAPEPIEPPAREPKPGHVVTPAPVPAPTVIAPAASTRRVVTAAVLEANRIAGASEILPDEATRTEMRRSGNSSAVGAYKICVGPDGAIETVNVLKSTGYPAYDAKIQSTIFATWRYRPIVIDGKPGPVCSGAKISTSSPSKLGNRPTWQ